ncbi:MAG: glycosyltransferase family 2 protein [Lentisphaerae bacterium]|nr:glycosyltransferase family 2 protein [Lentisphaerota bacterium]
MTDPLVTVGIPAYNKACRLREALDSLLEQSYLNLEVLISDDASSDETLQVCQEYAQKDPRIRYFRQNSTLGIARNHNFLLQKAKGAYFVWACDDDTRHPDFVSTLVDLLRRYPDAAGAMCHVRHIVEGVPRLIEEPKHCSNDCSQYDYLLYYARTGDYRPIGGMFVTEALRKARGYHADNRPYFRASDYLTILRLALQGRVVHTSEALFFKRDSGSAHNAFEVLSALQIDRATVRLMARYSCFPIFYLYNLVFGTRFVAESDLRLHQKFRVIAHLFGCYVRSNLEFGFNVTHGCCALFVGSVRWIARVGRRAKNAGHG